MTAYNAATLALHTDILQDPTRGLIEAQSLAFYPNPYTVSPSYSMMQTPWYLDYGHLVFWFFFFSTFVIVMWLFYIYTSVTYNIESRRPVRETRGFSRAQTGDTMTAVLPLTWSITMLAHASTHSTNFDENTTATTFSFSIIAYQWGWNYYFPRDVVEVLSAAPVLVGHKRVTYLNSQDPYSALLARSRHEYFARLSSTDQLVAKHGKHTLGQFLQAVFVGSRFAKDHAWFVAGLVPTLDFSKLKISQHVQTMTQNLAVSGGDIALTLAKDAPLSSALSHGDFLSAKQSLAVGFLSPKRKTLEVLGGLSYSGVYSGVLGGRDHASYTTKTLVNPRAHLFSLNYGKPKSAVNPFRAHNTVTYVGNRLGRIYTHLSSTTPLSVAARQGFLIRTLQVGTNGATDLTASLGRSFLTLDERVKSISPITIENIGTNHWLTRGFNEISQGVAKPWTLGMLNQNLEANNTETLGTNQEVLGALALTRTPIPSIPELTQGVAHENSSAINSSPKLADLYWLASEDLFTKFTSKTGSFDFAKYSQHFLFSGEDLTISGGEVQRVGVSDLAHLSANSANELSNQIRAMSRGLTTMLLAKNLHVSGAKVSNLHLNLSGAKFGLDAAAIRAHHLTRAMGAYNTNLGTLVIPNLLCSEGALSTFTLEQLASGFSSKGNVLNSLYRLDAVAQDFDNPQSPNLPNNLSEVLWVLGLSKTSHTLSTLGLKINPITDTLTGAGCARSVSWATTLGSLGVLSHANNAGEVLGYAQPNTPCDTTPKPNLGVVSDHPLTSAYLDSVEMLESPETPKLSTQPNTQPILSLVLGVKLLFFWHSHISTNLGITPFDSAFSLVSTNRQPLSPNVLGGIRWALLHKDSPWVQALRGDLTGARCGVPQEDDIVSKPHVGSLENPASYGQPQLNVASTKAPYSLVGLTCLTKLWLSSLSSGCHVGQSMYYEYIYVPAYVYVHLKSPLYAWLSDRFIQADQALFFINLGFGHVLSSLTSAQGIRNLWLTLGSVDRSADSTLQPVTNPLSNLCGSRVCEYTYYVYGRCINPISNTGMDLRPYFTEAKLPQITQVLFDYGLGSTLRQFVEVGQQPINDTYQFYMSAQTSPSTDTHWLEGISDFHPTRVSDAASNDIIFLNSKDLKPLDRGLNFNTPLLFEWWTHWSWEVLTSNTPWDKLFRSWTAKRAQGGLVNSTYATDSAKLIELTDLSRQRFDKNAVEVFVPYFKKLRWGHPLTELAPTILDSEFGHVAAVPVLVLPTPHLDVDPSFMFYTLTPEVNTSRRSDHDARYKVSWGPIAALNNSLSLTRLDSSTPWPKKSGPQALIGGSPKNTQNSSLLAGVNLYTTASTSLPNYARLTTQPLAGSVFSNPTQASVGLGLPTLSRFSSASLVLDLADFMGACDVGIGTRSDLEDLSLASVDVISSLEFGCRAQIDAGADTSLRYSIPSQWSSFWRLSLGSEKDLLGQILMPQAGLASHDILKLALASNHKAHLYSSLLWKHGRLVSQEMALHPASSSGLKEILGLTKDDAPLTGKFVGKRAGYAGIQPGVSNMRRLRVTQGIYLPADLPIHGIFGSKDVIHSWAIPGLGVKVDCIPGYSSHRRLFFRWRGLFWGQCMEVCGRYHHWMPLLVRVVHKDVFAVWCLTYLRMLTNLTPSNSYAFSLANPKLAWETACLVSQKPVETTLTEANALVLCGG